MSKPWIHSKIDAKKFGGEPSDYLHIHEWFDQTKGHIGDNRHRAILHTTFGIMLATQVFGETFARKSDGVIVSTRDVGESHVLVDNNNKFIPTMQDYLAEMTIQPWMLNGRDGYPPSCRKIEELENKQSKRSVTSTTIYQTSLKD